MTNKPSAHEIGAKQSGERISSLVDGELDDIGCHEAVDSLLTDKESCQCWERYHLISDTLKRNLPDTIDCQLASRVMAELENEPTVLAPSRINSSIGKQMAGLAIAASVATVAVLGVQFMYQEDGLAPSPQVAQLQQTQQLQGTKIPVNKEFIRRDIQTVTQAYNQTNALSQLPARSPAKLSAPKIVKQYHPSLNKYLLDHNQNAARGVVQGVMPYVRIITYPEMERIVRREQNQSQIQK